MNWQDIGIILSARKHGENSVILSALTREHGRATGLVRGGASKKLAAILQPGNLVQLDWKGRLEEHLGQYQVELLEAYGAKAMSKRDRLTHLNCLLAMCETCLPERDPVEGVFGASLILLDMIEDTRLWPEVYERWELGLLNELGFGLDLSSCASTGQTGDLIYISPKSGRAVSRNAGEPYKSRLFPLPHHLLADELKPRKSDLSTVFQITGHFFETRVLRPLNKKIPPARSRFVDRLK